MQASFNKNSVATHRKNVSQVIYTNILDFLFLFTYAKTIKKKIWTHYKRKVIYLLEEMLQLFGRELTWFFGLGLRRGNSKHLGMNFPGKYSWDIDGHDGKASETQGYLCVNLPSYHYKSLN